MQVKEEDVLFDKTYTCPCCGESFKTKAIRAGRNKLLKQDADLRPIYQYADATKYDAIVCTHCGYSGLIKNFDSLGDMYIKYIKEKVTPKFKGIDESKKTYTYEDAIERTQLALLSTVAKCAKTSEKAYICLKLAWLVRGLKESINKESINKESKDYEQVYAKFEKEELGYLKNAYTGLYDAYLNEHFPICGMDENTLALILAEIGRKLGEYRSAMRFITSVIMSRDVSERIKEMARDIKDNIKKEYNEEEDTE